MKTNGIEDACRTLGEALSDPIMGMKMLSGIGMDVTRWQRIRVRWAVWLGKTVWAQRIILSAIKRGTK